MQRIIRSIDPGTNPDIAEIQQLLDNGWIPESITPTRYRTIFIFTKEGEAPTLNKGILHG